jgi:hypothetical protein
MELQMHEGHEKCKSLGKSPDLTKGENQVWKVSPGCIRVPSRCPNELKVHTKRRLHMDVYISCIPSFIPKQGHPKTKLDPPDLTLSRS